MLLKATKIFEKKLGSEDASTLASTSILALIIWGQGRWEEAEKLEVQLIETYKTKLGPDHVYTVINAANLASTCKKQG